MEFTLFYDGILTSNAKAYRKHKIRKKFHQQLRTLWDQIPLDSFKGEIEKADSEESNWIVNRKNFKFVPLVSARLYLIARIQITMLLPGFPGQIVQRGGDIDNRLKTLLDALTMPNTDQTPDDEPDSDEDPFFCLLEDDKLITGLSVETDRLLKEGSNPDEVLLLIHIETKATVGTFENLTLGT